MISDESGKDEEKKINAIIRFHYRINPEDLDDETYYKLWHEYVYVKSEERKFQKGILTEVLNEVLQGTSS